MQVYVILNVVVSSRYSYIRKQAIELKVHYIGIE